MDLFLVGRQDMKKVWNFIWAIGIVTLFIISHTFAYTQEQQEAYQRAYQNEIISQPDIQAAHLNWMVTRQALSKMIINYLENAVWIAWNISDLCSFTDERKITNDLKYYTKKICAYKIMWKDQWEFNPAQPINRAQLWTILSRILWWDKYNSNGKWYYIYHVNALQDAGIMNNINNVSSTLAKKWDVLIMLKRMYDKFGTNVYLNNSWSSITTTTKPPQVANTGTKKTTQTSDNEYISNIYSNSNVIYTWKDWTQYYYDDKLLQLLGNAAQKKWETVLVDYLKIEAKYFKNGLDQLSSLDDEDLLKSIWIDVNKIDPNNMTTQEKQELIEKFKSALNKVIAENKDKNNKLLSDLEKVAQNIKNDKFWLKDKYKKTKTFIEASNNFLDVYSESIFNLMEIALKDNNENNEEWVAQTFWLLSIALAYQSSAEEYQSYVENRAIKTIKSLELN